MEKKISNNLEEQIANSKGELLDTIVSFKQQPSAADRTYLERHGCVWKAQFKIINAAHVLIPARSIYDIAKNESILKISENARSKAI